MAKMTMVKMMIIIIIMIMLLLLLTTMTMMNVENVRNLLDTIGGVYGNDKVLLSFGDAAAVLRWTVQTVSKYQR